jgi:hypothetical protein
MVTSFSRKYSRANRFITSYIGIIFIIVLVIIAVMKFLLPYYEVRMSNIALALVVAIAVFAVVIADFIRDRKKQEERILEHADHPSAFPENRFNILQTIGDSHQEHIQHLLKLVAHKFARHLKCDENTDVFVYLLCPTDDNQMKTLPEAYPEKIRNPETISVPLDQVWNSYRYNKIIIGTQSDTESPDPSQPAFEVLIPLQSNQKDSIAVLYLQGYNCKVDRDRIDEGVLTSLKYAFLIYNVLVEILKVESEVI